MLWRSHGILMWDICFSNSFLVLATFSLLLSIKVSAWANFYYYYYFFGEDAAETYQQTDKDFLDSERDSFRDDGSTASTAVLVGRHLYVANVGDSRTVISKAGKGIIFSCSFSRYAASITSILDFSGRNLEVESLWIYQQQLEWSRLIGGCIYYWPQHDLYLVMVYKTLKILCAAWKSSSTSHPFIADFYLDWRFQTEINCTGYCFNLFLSLLNIKVKTLK